jgi:UDP-N-acetylmuramate: L-alanyl-gamma-D-glutamyl-meso-diaminopimelate ligase
MHIHILGICGTFMGGVALIAKQLGHQVTGSDANVYPPMSTQLEAQGIALFNGYDPEQFSPKPDLVIVGNVISRGNPAMEFLLESDIAYTSGPQWMSENVLRSKKVIAVAGTHGKTTTASIVAWMLESLGLAPSFLIGGVTGNMGISARLTDSEFFVIEADEYDTAFFDKRSKFVHYHPSTLIINNLEFDHADIFENLAAIQKQFHHVVRVVPNSGCIIYPHDDNAIKQVLDQGCWSHTSTIGDQWTVELIDDDGGRFHVLHKGVNKGMVAWQMIGQHNINNALTALAALEHYQLDVTKAIKNLAFFKNVKRRMEVKGVANTVTVYDDFAHHPTAIKTTLSGLRRKVKNNQIIAIVDPRSNTMKSGVHKSMLADALQLADIVYVHMPETVQWTIDSIKSQFQQPITAFKSTDDIVEKLLLDVVKHSHVLVMSNGSFDGIHQKILDRLKKASELTLDDFWHSKRHKNKS